MASARVRSVMTTAFSFMVPKRKSLLDPGTDASDGPGMKRLSAAFIMLIGGMDTNRVAAVPRWLGVETIREKLPEA